ncbi:MAG: serine/threonine protein kinase [Deltaproteobacteria bacterium]|nr:serine/threonine protein kinase [Deltaproteobacteria bacterium]
MGQYYLLEKLAQGGMAEIYKGLAYDLHGIKRIVVIKKILPHIAANREFIDMLIAEAKIAVMLTHGNIAQIYDLGKVGADYFIVMEYVPGWSVSQIQRECAARKLPIPIPFACYITAEIAAGLDYMHERTDERGEPLHIVHRDVSPQNVILSESGTVKIIDFGIAKARTKLETTDVGILKGKFAYMSPEHANGEAMDHRSDIFSLGVILHEMLAGVRLFKARDQRETLRNVRRCEPAVPSTLRPDVSPALDAIVLQSLAKACDARTASAGLLRGALLRLLHQTFPEFRPQDVVTFLHQLFGEVEPEGEPEDAEGKTPLLISDFTQSAVVGTRGGEPFESIVEHGVPTVIAELMEPFGRERPMAPTVDEAPLAAETEADEVSVTVAGTDLQSRALAWLRRCRATGAPVWQAVQRLRLRPLRRREIGIVAGLCVLCGVGLLWISGTGALLWDSWQQRQPLLAERQPVVLGSEPVVATVALHVTSTPAGAKIFLDQRETGLVTPTTLRGLVRDHEYELGFFLDGYQYYRIPWNMRDATAKSLEIVLTPDYGRVKIETTPAGASLRIDGVARGHTPYQSAALLPGTVLHFQVVLPGYETASHEVRIQPGRTVQVRIPLRRQ